MAMNNTQAQWMRVPGQKPGTYAYIDIDDLKYYLDRNYLRCAMTWQTGCVGFFRISGGSIVKGSQHKEGCQEGLLKLENRAKKSHKGAIEWTPQMEQQRPSQPPPIKKAPKRPRSGSKAPPASKKQRLSNPPEQVPTTSRQDEPNTGSTNSTRDESEREEGSSSEVEVLVDEPADIPMNQLQLYEDQLNQLNQKYHEDKEILTDLLRTQQKEIGELQHQLKNAKDKLADLSSGSKVEVEELMGRALAATKREQQETARRLTEAEAKYLSELRLHANETQSMAESNRSLRLERDSMLSKIQELTQENTRLRINAISFRSKVDFLIDNLRTA